MEQMTPDPPDVSDVRPANHGRILLGSLAIAAGVLMMMDRLDLADVHLTTRLWPLVPLGLGLMKMIDPPQRRDGRHPGVWLVFIGGWGLVNEFHMWNLDYDRSWPLVIIFVGSLMVWRALHAPACGRKREGRQA